MLIEFLSHTGINDPDARGAIRYLTSENVLKPDGTSARRKMTKRARPPIPLSGFESLVRQTCAMLTTKHRYASGVIAFAKEDIDIEAFSAGDPAIRAICDEVMRDFEETAFAGIAPDQRPPVFWNAHIDKGKLELNFIFPRAALSAKGKFLAINPKPPGKQGQLIWDTFRDKWNSSQGWVDPLAPDRRRSMKLPSTAISNPSRSLDGAEEFDPRIEFYFDILDAIDDGKIKSRDDVVEFLAAQGHKIGRVGKDYISLDPLQSDQPDKPQFGKRIRLRGDVFSADFKSLDWLKERGFANEARPCRRDMSGAAELLEELKAKRAEHHQSRLGKSEEPAKPQQPIPSVEIIAETTDTEEAPRSPRNWHARYQPPFITKEDAALIRHIDPETHSIRLNDGSTIIDTETRLAARDQTEATIRLMLDQVRKRGWSGISVRGDEAFLRQATRMAHQAGIDITGRTPEMEVIVQAELAALSQQSNETSGEFFAKESTEPPKPKATTSKPKTFQGQLWARHYNALPEELEPALRFVDHSKRMIHLRDGSRLHDQGDRIHARKASEATFRFAILQAQSKGWSGISINGTEAFLRKATRIAIEMNFPIAGRTPGQEAIIRDEIKTIRAEHYDPMAGEVENIGPATAARPKERSYKADPISKAWEEIYGIGTLPDDLRHDITKIEEQPACVTLSDGASFEDHDSRITSRATTEASLRLIIAAALAKGWTGLSIKGEEAFLRMATRIAHEEGIEIQGRDDEMQAIIEEEILNLYPADQQPHADPSSNDFDSGSF
jgi:hypothetical protein